ncbi:MULTISPECIES: cupin domain-containing protein [unclassified Roseovarius]|jgi:mannose-6-phosphate isomerase-like protein (cupin superfamily)|uniref:cupin domain-containing protein n=1 Tax=unclassified Roseovarius TaxID=2614913 RepID=UPI0000685C48|nr:MULTISPECIES: hypothetical protein [unclassified Roseovarius]EAQ26467.1 hypothetical protein ROS217_14861 [Roseovarius sp. 217]
MNLNARSNARNQDFSVFTSRIDTADLGPLIESSLPDQGHIEVRRDVPGKHHSQHDSETDETLIVLAGHLLCYWDSGETIAGTGSVVAFPAGFTYGTVALDEGATYLIVFDQMKMPFDG